MSKRILITGGAGFIAHHLIDKILSTTDWEIITLDRLDFSGNLNRLQEVVSAYPLDEQKRVKVIHHDLKAELNPKLLHRGNVDLIKYAGFMLTDQLPILEFVIKCCRTATS